MKTLLLASTVFVTAFTPTSHRHCSQTFTVAMGKRAALAIYGGDRPVTLHQLRVLGYIERCQRNSANQPFVRSFDHHQAALHRQRMAAKAVLSHLSYATASWYEDAGATASGFHAYYGVANRYLAFGTRVLFVYNGRQVTAIVDDRGPYVGGRDWDLNQNTAAALGFGGVDTVGYHIG